MPLKQEVTEASNAMFSFIWTQPIHKTLRQMRVATIILLVISVDIMYRLVAILENASALSKTEVYASVGVLAAAVFATLWRGISNLAESHKQDEV